MKLLSISALLCAVGAVAQDTTFENPVLWQDLADLDIIRVNDTFYYSASTMHYSPGAPILRSYDLVNWEYAGHSVPELDFGPEYDLDGGRAYVGGIWASFFNYRPSNGLFYWGGCMRTMQTHIYTAEAPEGPWERIAILDDCYYDAGLLIDEDDKLYIAHGEHEIIVAELSDDGTSEVSSEEVYSWTEEGTVEGSRFYKIDGNYYILVTRPPDAQFALKSTDGPFGPYTIQPMVDNVGSPVPSSGAPHQGGIVDTQNGDWHYMAFIDAYPGGRVPVLAPVSWDSDGWPSVELVDGEWGASYPMPDVPAGPSVKPVTGVDSFDGTSLSHEWEWNHNPDNTKWSIDNGLVLEAATVTDDLYMARNTLTHRILGPSSNGTIALDYSSMTDGDRAGLALLRDLSATIGVVKDGDSIKVSMVDSIEMNEDWTNTTNKGVEVESTDISDGSGEIWLRISANISPDSNFEGTFSYSMDGTNFTPLGTAFVMKTEWNFFMGYRFGIFNYATLELGGSVGVSEFELVAN